MPSSKSEQQAGPWGGTPEFGGPPSHCCMSGWVHHNHSRPRHAAPQVITFILLAGGVWSRACLTAAGYIGFLCGSTAIYTAFAELWQDQLGITLPGLSPIRLI
jgi:hypothetical protein